MTGLRNPYCQAGLGWRKAWHFCRQYHEHWQYHEQAEHTQSDNARQRQAGS